MTQPEIIVTAPLPAFLYEPLKADYRCHDYHAASHKPGLLTAEGARIRGLVQGGGTVTPTSLLDALPKLELISVFGVGYDGVPIDYCRKRGIKVTNTPDVLTDDVADVAVGLILMSGRGFAKARAIRACRPLGKGGRRTHDQAGRQEGRHPRPGPHRQGDRTAAGGDGHAHRVHGAQGAVGRQLSLRPRLEDARGGV